MNDTKGSNEKKELSFAEQMKKEIAERDKADNTLEELKSEIENYKWQKSKEQVDKNIERIKNALKDRIKKRQYITKDNKNVVELEYMYCDSIIRPSDKIEAMFRSLCKKMGKSYLKFCYELGMCDDEGLGIFPYRLRPTVKTGNIKVLLFNSKKTEMFFEGKELELLQMLIEKLKSDGIIVERICNKDKSIVFENIHEVKKYKKEHLSFYDTILCIKMEF